MQIKDLIKKKQNSEKHTTEEISYLIKNINTFTHEEITQWLKAVKANGLDNDETSVLTLEMAQSGTTLDWRGYEPLIDKHSTGGIGDKITLLFAPLVSAYGINIPKLSGRGLGITGGTIDKLESISGLRTNLTINEIKEQVKKIGLAVGSAGSNLAPADKKLYAIRDVTDTVDSIPLIASSIMSKKIAGGSPNIILDVKFGSGAFMKTLEDSKLLASTMVTIGKKLNKKIKAVISSMYQPLGYAVGNTLEIKEVIDVMSGKEIEDLLEVTICLAREAINLTHGKVPEEKELKDLLLHGRALKKFEEMIQAQGGDLSKGFKRASYIETMSANTTGYIQNIDARIIGEAVHALGAGRKQVTDQIEHSVGVIFYKKYGDKVTNGEPIVEIHAKSKEDFENAKKKMWSAITYGQNHLPQLKLISEIVG